MRASAITATLFATLALSLAFAAPPARAQPRFVEAGSLTCNVRPSVGLIVGSRQRLHCRFVRLGDGRTERYFGRVTRFGPDFGITTGGVLVWSVFANTRTPRPGFLAGHYVGASADVSFGLGLGAKALIGGSRRTTMLQPISVSGRTGVNLAFGVTGLTLRFAD